MASTQVLEALKAAGPAEAPQMMAVTAKPAQLDELAAILVQGATALSEQDADRIKQSTVRPHFPQTKVGPTHPLINFEKSC